MNYITDYCKCCKRVATILVEPGAAALIYRCFECGTINDWEVVDDVEFELEMRSEPNRRDFY